MSAAGGVLIAIGGVWLGCQVFGGRMLDRLGILGSFTTGADAAPATAAAGASLGSIAAASPMPSPAEAAAAEAAKAAGAKTDPVAPKVLW